MSCVQCGGASPHLMHLLLPSPRISILLPIERGIVCDLTFVPIAENLQSIRAGKATAGPLTGDLA
jgi:hypothetical protein